MPPTLYPTSALAGLLRRETVASMPRIMAALGTSTRRTVVRKLAALDHLTSYSHAGRFYALPESARFDQHGLWSFRGIRFSSHGTLRATAEALVRSAPAGLFVPELDALLQVASGDALRHLASHQRLAREKCAGRFLYCTSATDRRRGVARTPCDLVPARSLRRPQPLPRPARRAPAPPLRRPRLPGTRPRRRPTGRRPDRPQSLHGRPRTERTALWQPAARSRPASWWRPPSRRKKNGALSAALADLLQHDTAGDPCGGLRWVRRTTARLAEALAKQGFPVCDRTVARLLASAGFALRLNRKHIPSVSPQHRNAQFEFIADLKRLCAHSGRPLVS